MSAKNFITDPYPTKASVSGTVNVAASALPANAAKETGGNLAGLTAKDFATQTTLALIKAKTDNIDVALSTRTKPSDQQHVIIDSGSVTTGGLTDAQLRAAAVPVSGTFFQATQPISAASLPLPASASTSGPEKIEDAAAASGDTGYFVLGVRNSGAAQATATNTDGDYSQISVDARGNAVVALSSASVAFSDGLSNTEFAARGQDGSFVASFTFGYQFNGTTWDRTRGNTSGTFVQINPAAAATGLTRFRNVALTNTAVAVKASAGNVYSLNVYNPGAALAYLHFYNVAAASVTVGTTVPDWSIALPSTATGTVGLDQIGELPYFTASGAFSVAASTTANGGTAPGTALVVNIGYV